MKGIIEEISHETSKSGEYLRILIDGVKYSVWDPEYFDTFQQGDMIEFDYKESGKWKNITKLEVIDLPEDEISDKRNYKQFRDKQITKMSCLKSAAYLLANIEKDSIDKGRETINLARAFENYINEDDELRD